MPSLARSSSKGISTADRFVNITYCFTLNAGDKQYSYLTVHCHCCQREKLLHAGSADQFRDPVEELKKKTTKNALMTRFQLTIPVHLVNFPYFGEILISIY